MKLTDTKIKTAKPREKGYRLSDGAGLYLWIAPSGVKSWQYRYKLAGKPQMATLDRYPSMGLADAREAAREARSKVAEGRHLTTAKRIAKATMVASQAKTFEALAAEWVEAAAKPKGKRRGWSADHKVKVTASIKRHLSELNGLPVDSITAAICFPVLQRTEARAPILAGKVRQRLDAILDYAVLSGLIDRNPLPKMPGVESNNLPAVLSQKGIGEILRAADKAQTRSSGMKRAHLLCALTAQRIQTVVSATWADVDLESGTWTIEREQMKRKDAERGVHVVPLPPDLLRQMTEWKRADGHGAKWVCPNESGKGPVTREGVEVFYRRKLDLSGKHSPHSWRSVFKTWSLEAGEDNDVVRAQMDHIKKDRTEAAYDRSTRLEQRRVLMARHEERLLAARDGRKAAASNVVALRGAA
jgi:integrase